MARIDNLADYLAGAAERGFVYGVLDCCTFMADWLLACGYGDAMADRRGAYASRAEYEALMGQEGGIVASCSRRFAAIGLPRAATPDMGDVCLVEAPTACGRTATGAIVVSERLRAVVTPDAGLVMADLRVLRVWRVSRA